MNINQMRQWLFDHYKNNDVSPRFLASIRRMPDRQVIAIYRRLQEKPAKKH